MINIFFDIYTRQKVVSSSNNWMFQPIFYDINNYSPVFMYPNYHPYQPQQPPMQQNINHNQMQPVQQTHQPNFVPYQQPIQSPPDNNRLARNMYKSTIQTTTTSANNNKSGRSGFGKLESMGRFIQEAPEPSQKMQQAPKVINTPFNNVVNFRNDKHDGARMATSVIFNRETEEELNRFPSFSPNQPTGGLSKLEALMNRNKIVDLPKEETNTQTPEEKRKKQILTIKQQLELLNKKMENKGFRKVVGNTQGGNKPYFQLPTRKTGATTTIPSAVNSPSNMMNPNSNLQATKQKDVNIPVQIQNTSQNYQTQNYPQTNFVAQNYQPSNSYQSQYQNTIQTTNNRQPVANSINDFKPALAASKPSNVVSQSPSSSVSTSGSSWVSPNNFQIPKSQEGGMFKKKNPYLSDESLKAVDYQPKTILMPSKITTTTNASLDLNCQIKATEVIQLPKPKKTVKIMETFQYEQNISKLPNSTPRQFKKSDFAIGKKLGKGQYGQVMLVQHKQTGFLMGLKVMSKKQIREEKYENQIARQLSINFYLTHRNIAPLYGYFSDEENVYLLVQYCTGGQLLSLLRKNNRMEDPEVSPIIRQICEGLDYIHKEGIIHRDIKPENILFNFNTVKICDFGWAVYSHNGMRRTVSGSPLYYSPQIVMETEYDQKIDIWSIGMMTYECLLGKIPFRIYSQLDLNRIVEDEIKFPEYVDVTDQAKDFILRIMKKKPQDRMEIKQMMRHPFITKYLKTGKLSGEVIEEFRKVLS